MSTEFPVNSEITQNALGNIFGLLQNFSKRHDAMENKTSENRFSYNVPQKTVWFNFNLIYYVHIG